MFKHPAKVFIGGVKMTHLIRKMVLIPLLAAGIAGVLAAEDGKSVVQKSLDVPRPRFTHSAVKMELIDSNNSVDERMIEEWAKDPGDKTGAALIVFRQPASVKDTRFLQIVNKDRANDKWIYMPALRTTRRIASADGAKSFMGTDASYDDLETRKIDEDTHELLGTETVGPYTCYKVESTPVNVKSSQYLKRISYIDQETSIPVKIEMYDKKGVLLKVLEIEKIEKQGDYRIPMQGKMTNVQTKHTTRITILKLELDKPINDKMFTQNFLNTGKL